MDLNAEFWRTEGQTFSQRFLHWLSILDPGYLFASYAKIENARALLARTENITESLQDKKMKEAWNLSLGSVHPGTGDIIPALFRPTAFPLCSTTLLLFSLLPHRRENQAIWQFIFHSYLVGFGFANGNSEKRTNKNGPENVKEYPYKELLFSSGTVLFSAFCGTFPHFVINHIKPQRPSVQLLFKYIIPGPLTATLAAFNLTVIRTRELEEGIEVMDSKGKVIGVSQRAGIKAVEETALSRAALFGTAILVPDLILLCLRRAFLALQNPLVFNPLRYGALVFIYGAVIPVSFSWMPQIGTIKRSVLEPEIASSTEETELFYNRGL
ncbi:sideroflexin-4 isoform X2 [Varanus komodoensis]|uniref:sideroflexin-4 isoform X2 n=1 Tax=Varanus komodoensis TaxID=61221 RepID=UPI001CF7DD2D|nr:sideroflexin-4 isoform X2 [Varanus komodoensis]